MPRWASNVAVLVAVYVGVMIAAIAWLPHEWDWDVFGWLSSRSAPAFSSQVELVNVDWNLHDVPSNRTEVAAFLDGLVASKQRPRAVVLDIEFDPCPLTPCAGRLELARQKLAASIQAAARSFGVYATEEMPVDRDDIPSGPLDPQDPQIYGAISGAAQTRITHVPSPEGFFYRVCYDDVPSKDESGAAVGMTIVWSMVDRVLIPADAFARTPCDTGHLTVRIGAGGPHVYNITSRQPFPNAPHFDEQYVIVGTLQHDRPVPDISGPELLGWAMSNALDRMSAIGARTAYDTQPQNGMLILLIPIFSGLAVLAFMAIFYPLKRTRLRSFRHLLPGISAALAALAGIAIFAGFEAWMLEQGHIQPQITLIVLGVVTASGLSGFRGFQMMQDEASAIDPVPTEKYDYDVFISYAHEEGAWVSEHVYVPLRDATLPNGRKLSVFFDTSSIRSGTGWQTKLALALDASRFIVPVYSETYFKKPYCRFEILRSHRRWVLAGDESRCVLPVMRGHPKIFATVDDIQALSIDDHPDLVGEHVAEIVDRLARETGAGDDRSEEG